MNINTPNLSLAQLNYADTAQWKLLIKQAMADARMASPAFLTEDMPAGAQTVTVQIAQQERVKVPTGSAWWDVLPIVNVPVQMPRGGGYSITVPLKKGDEGLLVFSDTCFDNWWRSGQANAPKAANVTAPSGSTPQFEVRRHWVHDAIFIPGVWSQPNVLSDYSTDSLQIRSDDGQTVIDVSETGVAITASTVTAANGGDTQVLVTDAFYQWFVVEFLPTTSYMGPLPPANSITTILKGQ